MSNDQGRFIPVKWRKAVYGVWTAVSLLLGATQVWFTTVNSSVPIEVTGAIAVWTFVGSGVGVLALANAPASNKE